jgi:hypothetical protein
MVHRPVVPDSQVIHVLPAVPHLQVVVLDDKLHEPAQEVRRLLIAEAVDLLHVVADGEDGLPAGDGVRADDGVDGLEKLADVLGGAAFGRVDAEAVAVGGLVEAGLGVGGCEGVEEGSEGGRDAVVDLVAGSPEGV